MKTILLFLLQYLGAQVLVPQSEWYIFKDQEISIEFPQAPELASQTVPTAIGDLELKIASYEGAKDEDSNFAYIFISSVYPDSLINSNRKEKLSGFFRSSIDGAVKNVNGKLISENEVELDGYPGREVMIDFGDGQAIIKFRMYLVKNRTYFIQTISQTGKEGNADATRFHKSFKLQK